MILINIAPKVSSRTGTAAVGITPPPVDIAMQKKIKGNRSQSHNKSSHLYHSKHDASFALWSNSITYLHHHSVSRGYQSDIDGDLSLPANILDSLKSWSSARLSSRAQLNVGVGTIWFVLFLDEASWGTIGEVPPGLQDSASGPTRIPFFSFFLFFWIIPPHGYISLIIIFSFQLKSISRHHLNSGAIS